MVARIQDMCRDPAVAVLGLEDGLVPENDDFNLGMVRKREISGKGSRIIVHAANWGRTGGLY